MKPLSDRILHTMILNNACLILGRGDMNSDEVKTPRLIADHVGRRVRELGYEAQHLTPNKRWLRCAHWQECMNPNHWRPVYGALDKAVVIRSEIDSQIVTLYNQGMLQPRIAKKLGKTPRYIRNRISILRERMKELES